MSKVISAYTRAKSKFYGEIASMGGNITTAKNLQKYFSGLLNPQNKSKGNSEDQLDKNIAQTIRDRIAKEVDVKLEEGLLAIDPEDPNKTSKYFKGYENKARGELVKSSSSTISKTKLKNLIEQLNSAIENFDKDLVNTNANVDIEKAKGNLAELQKLFNDASRQTVHGKGIGINLTKKDGDIVDWQDLINKTYKMIHASGIAQKTGAIGEWFVYLALQHLNEISANETNNLIKQLNLSGNSQVIPTGAVPEHNLYYSDFSEEIGVDDGTLVAAARGTQGKADITISYTDDTKALGFSVKNYTNPSQITLLRGNLGPLFNNYINFINHYIALTTSNERDNAIALAKNIAKFKALTGGVLTKEGKGSSAAYLVVNDTTGKRGLRVWSTKWIAEHYLKNLSQSDNKIFKIENRNNFKFEAPYGHGKGGLWRAINKSDSHISLMVNSLKASSKNI